MSETDDNTLIAALWRVVAAHGWDGLTMRRLAGEADLSLAELRRRFPSRLDLLVLHGSLMDRTVLAGTIPGQGGLARDRLFDVLMRRLDAMQPHRAGILRLLDDMRRDPGLAALLGPHLVRSMRWMLDAAEVDADAPMRRLLALGLVGVWIGTVRAWIEDESEDLGHTMAALDRLLDRAGQIGRTLRLLPDEAPSPTPVATPDA
ncbi:helix-turn-helix transcriptional regulator [Roseomonas terrae]|jgi:ubiquinone biosynthesis protein COQ9|uniref:Helix-turn-helix transcriptional regulator n=1 Tax=Neoroseomonas terrae TaxID=424799 RepID=A0ABS5EAN9_9PROT|nr:TetR family transcriptional regulator [Neoroseomonas terrae]MBR0648075.1 helix-turn-helix transcriptional regulator [Neoroseomonas terrae]